MKVPHLMSIRPMECCIATLNASSATISHALQQTKAARVGVILQGASSAPHFLLARLQRYSFQLVFQLCSLSRVHLGFTLSVSCKLLSRNYVRTSVNFSLEQAGGDAWKNNSRCLKNVFAFSGQNQAHNLTNIFHMNVLSNMPLEGLSARVLQCSQFPSYIVAVFNSFSKRSCLHTPCSFPLTVPCRLLSRNYVGTSGDLSLKQVRLEMWCIWSRYE